MKTKVCRFWMDEETSVEVKNVSEFMRELDKRGKKEEFIETLIQFTLFYRALLELAEAGMINYTYSKGGEGIEVLKRMIRDNIEFLTEAGYGPANEEDWKHI